jgi:(2R)-sulfolactate sulfo-lyase subunit alpha
VAKRNSPQFLVHSPKDNVGVIVVEDLKSGTKMEGTVTENDSDTAVTAKHDIPIGHKVALKDLRKGDTVMKYGEDVGIMTKDAKIGDHVHVHNMKTKRW